MEVQNKNKEEYQEKHGKYSGEDWREKQKEKSKIGVEKKNC